jgi:hypothetical protein
MLSPLRNPYFSTRSERRTLRNVKGRLENCFRERPAAFSVPDACCNGRIDPAYGVDRVVFAERLWYRSVVDS